MRRALTQATATVVVVAAVACVLVPSAAAAATISVGTTADDVTGNAANCPGTNCGLRDAIAYANAKRRHDDRPPGGDV
jgi:CSLREA domain-containing protein